MTSFLDKIVFGTGGRFGRLSLSRAQSLVDFAIENGIYNFDTGYFYCNQKSQSLLFRCLQKWCDSSISSRIQISTKIPACSSELFSQLVANTIDSLPSGAHIANLFVWGPTLADLNNTPFVSHLSSLKSSGYFTNVGVNTHDFSVMSSVADSLFPWNDIMLDYNLIQLNRELFFKSYHHKHINIWAGTSLCQGFLLQNLLSMTIRTRSISYLARALFHHPTILLRRKASILRQLISARFPQYCDSLPLWFVLHNPNIHRVPIGMLSKQSIAQNISVSNLSIPPDVLRVWTISQSLLCDVT